MHTVKRVCDLAGITRRTLRHYDAIGLLEPSSIGGNGYRYYDDAKLLELQQILIYRELGMPLENIRVLMRSPGRSALAALESHRVELLRRAARLERLALTVEETIAGLKGGRKMEGKELFKRFTEAEEDANAEEAAARWDPKVVAESMRKYRSYSNEKKDAIFAEANGIYAELVDSIPSGPASERTQSLVERWRENIRHFWTPDAEALAGLAELYNEDPRFKANFDKIDPRLAPFMREAVAVYLRSRS